MSSDEDHRALVARLLTAQQQLIDCRARLDREHQAGDGFLRFSERALDIDELEPFWRLAAEEVVTTFSTEYAMLLRLDGAAVTVCATCCAGDVTADELTALGALAREALARRTVLVPSTTRTTVAGRPAALLLVGGVRDQEDGRPYALVAGVSVAKQPFFPTFDASFVPIYAAFVNHVSALQQHIRARAEARLANQQRKRLAEVASRTSNAVIITDRNGHIEWVNDGFVRLTGWRLDEVLGHRPGAFLQGPKSSRETIDEMREWVRARQPFEVEILNYSKAGREYWVQIEARVTVDERGEPSGFIALESDVTARRLTEQREVLTQRVAALLLSADSVEAGGACLVAEIVAEIDMRAAQVWLVDPLLGRLAYVAGAVAPSLGPAGPDYLAASRELPFESGRELSAGVGVPGLVWGTGKVVLIDDLSVSGRVDGGLSRRLDAALAAGVRTLCAAPVLGPDGVIGVIEIGSTFDHPTNAILASILERLAEQFAAFVQQDLSRRAFRSVFEHSPDGLLVVDPDGHVRAANARAQAMFGDVDGAPLDRLLEGGGELLGAVVQTATQGAAAVPAQLFRRAAYGPDGSEFSSEVSVASTSLSATRSTILSVRDLTERHRMELALTRSLEEKETLLKEIHHRVKNNLQIISSLLMLQSEHMPSDKTRAMLEESVFRVRSMALIHQQLYGVDSLARIDLGEYARSLTGTLRSTLAPAARIALRLAPAEVTIEVAVPLGLILNELITNAFKYGMRPPGEPRAPGASGPDCDVLVEVGAEGDTVRIAVTDSGPGLPLEVNPARASTLGLQLVRSLTRQLRGKLTVERDGGTRFALGCPRALGD